MQLISVTFEVSHPPIGWLKDFASLNIWLIFVIFEVSLILTYLSFSKLQNALTVYDNHKGNIKIALQILTEIKEGKNNTCSVLIDDKPKKSKGRWSSALTATLKNLYEDYSNISIKTLSKQSTKLDSDSVKGNEKENNKN